MANPPEPPPRLGQELLDGLEAATADFDNLSLVGLDGEDPALDSSSAALVAAPAPEPAANPEPGARELDGGANLEIALERDERTGQARPPAPRSASSAPSDPSRSGGALKLDFDEVGVSAGAKGESAPRSELAAPSRPAVAPRRSEPEARPASSDGKVGLFGPDRALGFLVAATIGLLLGIIPALQSGRAQLETETQDTIAELEDAVERPLAVRAGDVRSPTEISADIERQYAPARARFWAVWLGIAIPVTLVLGLVRRKA